MPENNAMMEAQKYHAFYETPLGEKILKKEADIVEEYLTGCGRIMDLGCGPGVFEKELSHLNIIGIDSSREMITLAEKNTEADFRLSTASNLPFPDDYFDGAFTISTLAFIGDVEKALEELKRVLTPESKALFMLCNTNSNYFKEKLDKPGYTSRNIKHLSLEAVIDSVKHGFHVKEEAYMLGISKNEVYETNDQAKAALYVMKTGGEVQ